MDQPELSVPWCILGRRETAVRDGGEGCMEWGCGNLLERGRRPLMDHLPQSRLGSALEIWAPGFMVDFRLRIGRVRLRAKLREEKAGRGQ